MGKYEALYRLVVKEGLVDPAAAIDPGEASWSDLALVHTPAYLDRLKSGGLSRTEERRLGLPWSPVLLRRSRMAVAGTIEAARFALADGIGANLAGGTHHAFPDHGEGYCVLNDVAVAVAVLRRSGEAGRVLVVDLDVHQGNGTAAIFADDPETFTFSMHGARNYPWVKPASSLDVNLPDQTGDESYMEALVDNLEKAYQLASPELVFYLAGVDTVVGDRFGRLAMTVAGLRLREQYVLGAARRRGVPLAMLLAGGYAKTPLATARLHAVAHRERKAVYGDSGTGH